MATPVDQILIQVTADLSKLNAAMIKMERTISRSTNRTNRVLSTMNRKMLTLPKTIASIGIAFAGLSLKDVIFSFAKVGSEVENLSIRMGYLFNDLNAGGQAFQSMLRYSQQVPFTLREIQLGSANLAVVAEDVGNLTNVLEMTGNVAASAGLDFETAAVQIQRVFSAGANSADLFRERGVLAMAGFTSGVKVSVDESRKAFLKVFGPDGRFANAATDLADTLTGIFSMIKDRFFVFAKEVADAGFFAELKNQATLLNEQLKLQEGVLMGVSRAISDVLSAAVKSLGETIRGVIDRLPGFVFGTQIVFQKLGTLFELLKGVVLAFTNDSIAYFKVWYDSIEGYFELLQKLFKVTFQYVKDVFLNVTTGLANVWEPFVDFLRSKWLELIESVEGLIPLLIKLGFKMKGVMLSFKEVSEAAKDRTLESYNKLLKKTAKFTEGLGYSNKLFVAELALLKVKYEELQGENKEATADINELGEALENFAKKNPLKGGIAGLAKDIKKVAQYHRDLSDLLLLISMEDPRGAQKEKPIKISADFKKTMKDLENEYKRLEGSLSDVDAEFMKLTEKLELKDEINELKLLRDQFDAITETKNWKALKSAVGDAFESLGQGMSDALFTQGKGIDKFKMLLAEFAKDLAKTAIQMLIFNRIKNAIFDSSLPTIGPDTFSRIGGFFGFGATNGIFAGGSQGIAGGASYGVPMTTGSAGGGTVQAGVPTIVGERGAEMFIPHSSGRIVNNMNAKNMSAGGSITVNQNINLSTGVEATVRSEVQQMLPAIKNLTINAIVDAKKRNEFQGAL